MNLNITKRLISLMSAGVLSLSMVGHSLGANAEELYAVTNTSGVNIRVDAKKDSTRLAQVGKGCSFKFLEELENGWYKILYNGEVAYVDGRFADVFVQSQDETSPIVVRSTTEGLRVRDDTNTNGNVITHLAYGDVLDYVETMPNGWYKVKVNGRYGYVSNDYSFIDYEGVRSETCNFATANQNCRVRMYDTVDSDQIGYLKRGESLRCTGKTPNGWYQVDLNGQVGYIREDLVDISSKVAVVNNVYSLVSMKNDTTLYADRNFTQPIATVPRYELGNVYSRGEDYCLIASDSGTGYVRKGDTNFIGNSAVVVDISSQTVTYYKNAQPYMSSATVTGKDSTPTSYGVYSILSKERNRTLRGEGYETPVSYWMPFNGGQGLHDASWRSKFGGTIYHKNGSHGCVNLPESFVSELYDEVEKGTPVLVKR